MYNATEITVTQKIVGDLCASQNALDDGIIVV